MESNLERIFKDIEDGSTVHAIYDQNYHIFGIKRQNTIIHCNESVPHHKDYNEQLFCISDVDVDSIRCRKMELDTNSIALLNSISSDVKALSKVKSYSKIVEIEPDLFLCEVNSSEKTYTTDKLITKLLPTIKIKNNAKRILNRNVDEFEVKTIYGDILTLKVGDGVMCNLSRGKKINGGYFYITKQTQGENNDQDGMISMDMPHLRTRAIPKGTEPTRYYLSTKNDDGTFTNVYNLNYIFSKRTLSLPVLCKTEFDGNTDKFIELLGKLNYNSIKTNDENTVLVDDGKRKPYVQKIGRLIKSCNVDLSASEIENLTNTYKSHVNFEMNIQCDIIEGEDILECYKRDNYDLIEDGSTLNGSCMNDQLERLDLYKENTNIVKMLRLTSPITGKVIGRTILWMINGNLYHDRIYTSAQWLNKFMEIKAREMGIKNVREGSPEIKGVKLKLNRVYDNTPYLDSFYLNKGRKSITLNEYYS